MLTNIRLGLDRAIAAIEACNFDALFQLAGYADALALKLKGARDPSPLGLVIYAESYAKGVSHQFELPNELDVLKISGAKDGVIAIEELLDLEGAASRGPTQ